MEIGKGKRFMTRFGTNLLSNSLPNIFSTPRYEGNKRNRLPSETLWRNDSTKMDDELYWQYECVEVGTERPPIENLEKSTLIASNTAAKENQNFKDTDKDVDELNKADTECLGDFSLSLVEAGQLRKDYATTNIHATSAEGEISLNQEKKKMADGSNEVIRAQETKIHCYHDSIQNDIIRDKESDENRVKIRETFDKPRNDKRYESSCDADKASFYDGKRKYLQESESSVTPRRSGTNSYPKPYNHRKGSYKEYQNSNSSSNTIYSQSTKAQHPQNSTQRGLRDSYSDRNESTKSFVSSSSQEPYKKYKRTLFRPPKYPLDELK